MNDSMYEDDNCTYSGGDPRFSDDTPNGVLVLTECEVRFQGDRDSIAWPKSSILDVAYYPTLPVDLDAIARTSGIDAAQDIAIGLGEECVPDPGLSIHIADREEIYPEGFDVRIVFRNEYYAKVFGKRIAEAYSIPYSVESWPVLRSCRYYANLVS